MNPVVACRRLFKRDETSLTDMDQALLRALDTISGRLRGKGVRWALIGSTSLALQGVDLEPEDIDILTDRVGAFRMGLLLKEFETKPISFGELDIFRSYFGKYEIHGVRVEVMGDLEICTDGEWVDISHRLESPGMVTARGMEIPVSPLEEQLEAYETIGRKKDQAKIEKIKQVLDRK